MAFILNFSPVENGAFLATELLRSERKERFFAIDAGNSLLFLSRHSEAP